MSTTRPAVAPPRWPRIALALLTPLVLLGYLAAHHESVEAGASAISVADPGWILIGGCCAVLTWLAATACQLGAIDGSVPLPRLLATQVASSFVGHVLPVGVAQVGLNFRMLRRSGLTSEQAVSASLVSTAASAIVHVVTLVVLIGFVSSPMQIVSPAMLIAAIGGTLTVGLAAFVITNRLGRRATKVGAHARATVTHLCVVARCPRRGTLLWSGSIGILVLHITTLVAVLHALDQRASIVTVSLVYLAASAIGAIIPGPGGFGGFDVLLASALVASGLTGGYAAAAVIGYRALTVWLPLVPSAATFFVLLHRRIV